eukprot:954944-Pelagomonas_calceolata.AAC.5
MATGRAACSQVWRHIEAGKAQDTIAMHAHSSLAVQLGQSVLAIGREACLHYGVRLCLLTCLYDNGCTFDQSYPLPCTLLAPVACVTMLCLSSGRMFL